MSACTSLSLNLRPMDRFALKTLHANQHPESVKRGGEKVRVGRVHRGLIFGCIVDETFVVREGYVGWGGAVTLVVGDDLNTIILPDTNTSGSRTVSTMGT